MTFPLHYTISDEGDKNLERYAEKMHENYCLGFEQVVPNARVQSWQELSNEEKHAYRIGIQGLLFYICEEEMAEVEHLVAGQFKF